MFENTITYFVNVFYAACAWIWLWLQRDKDRAIAEVLFHSNHYAMQHKQSLYASQVYSLKNKIIEMFYQLGYCQDVTIHRQSFECWSCGGTGQYSDWQECYKCDGTGVYRSVLLYRFRFVIGQTQFIWHQPKPLVNFDVVLSNEDVGKFDDRPKSEQVTGFDVRVAVARMEQYVPFKILFRKNFAQAIQCDLWDIRHEFEIVKADWLYRWQHRNDALDAEYPEDQIQEWLCVCGHYQDDGFHCDECGREPPWGCDCSFCQDKERERYEIEDMAESFPSIAVADEEIPF
jgi:hypothetical protein